MEYIFPKPKLRVALHFETARAGSDQQDTITLHGTNLGPGRILVNTVLFRSKGRGFSRPEYGHLRDGRSIGLPKKIEVGEEFIVFLPTADAQNSERVGFEDSWGRRFWVTKSEMRSTRPRARPSHQNSSPAASVESQSLGLSQKT